MSAYPIVDNRLGEEARQVREDQDLTLRELAKLAGVNWHTIQRWETGESSPSVNNAQAVLAVLGKEFAIVDKGAGR